MLTGNIITGRSHMAWMVNNPRAYQIGEPAEPEAPEPKLQPMEPISETSSEREWTIAHWQEKEMNANNFPEVLGARLMRLNAETGYEIGDGLRGLYETLTDWNKFKAVMNKEIPNPEEIFEGVKSTYQSIKALPADQRANGAYKLLVGGFARAGAGKVATTAGCQLGKGV